MLLKPRQRAEKTLWRTGAVRRRDELISFRRLDGDEHFEVGDVDDLDGSRVRRHHHLSLDRVRDGRGRSGGVDVGRPLRPLLLLADLPDVRGQHRDGEDGVGEGMQGADADGGRVQAGVRVGRG